MTKLRTISITPEVCEFVQQKYKDKYEISWPRAFNQFWIEHKRLTIRARKAESEARQLRRDLLARDQEPERQYFNRLIEESVSKDEEIARLKEELAKQDQELLSDSQEDSAGQQREGSSDFFQRLKYFERRTKLAEKARDRYKARCLELEEKSVSAINASEERQHADTIDNLDQEAVKINLALAEERIRRITKERDKYKRYYGEMVDKINSFPYEPSPPRRRK